MSGINKKLAAAANKAAGSVNAEARAAAARVARPIPAAKIHSISVDRITKQENIRHHEPSPETDPGLAELATSIKQVGIIEPLIVNKAGNKYLLVSGYRRLAAAKLADFLAVPAKVYEELTPKQTLEIQLSENLHRRDLSPVEEAEVYVRMRDELGMEVVDIALRVGRSARHVQRYLQLLKLDDDTLDGIDSGDISISKAVYLTTLPEKIQERLVSDSYLMKVSTVADFIKAVKSRYMHDIYGNSTVFDAKAVYRDADGKVYPACTNCPENRQVELFPELVGEGSCFNEDCYWAKDDIAREQMRKAEAAKNKKSGASADGEDAGEYDDRGDVRELDDDDEIEEDAEAERKELEEQFNSYLEDARKKKKVAEYYLDILSKESRSGFDASRFFGAFDVLAPDSFGYPNPNKYTRYAADAVVLDELLVKYVGENYAGIKQRKIHSEIIDAFIVYAVYDNCDYRGDDIAEWLGCEEYAAPEKEEEAKKD